MRKRSDRGGAECGQDIPDMYETRTRKPPTYSLHIYGNPFIAVLGSAKDFARRVARNFIVVCQQTVSPLPGVQPGILLIHLPTECLRFVCIGFPIVWNAARSVLGSGGGRGVVLAQLQLAVIRTHHDADDAKNAASGLER